MATWIAHLRIAEILYQVLDNIDPNNFSIGSLAPDYDIPNSVKNSAPSIPRDSHFGISDEGTWRVADLEFYRRYITLIGRLPEDSLRLSFLLGYAFHLVTDNIWDKRIFQPTRERFYERFESDPNFIWEVKRDWYGIDFEYIHANHDSGCWQVFLQCRYDHDYLDFMPHKAVKENLERIRDFYHNKDNVLERWIGNRPNIYLSVSEMDSFIEDTGRQLIRIYQFLGENDVTKTNCRSVLELPIDGNTVE
jgi:hypothetical protein